MLTEANLTLKAVSTAPPRLPGPHGGRAPRPQPRQDLFHLPGLWLQIVEVANHHHLPFPKLVGEGAFDGQPTHLLGHPLVVVPGLGPEGLAAATALGGPEAPGAGPAGR